MDRVDHSIPYQALDASSDTSRTTVQGNVRRAASNGNISTVSGSSDSFRTLSSSRGQSPVALLVDGMEQEQSRPLDLFAGSPSGGSKGTSTGGRGGRKRTVSFWPLVLLIFYGVSGGPFGVEPVVAAGGPLLALAGFVFLPLVWSIPEALVTAELSTTFPEAAGCVAWVSAAYGPFWGWMEGYCSWVSGVTDNSLYPVLFLDYLVSLLPDDSFLNQNGLGRWGCIVGVNLGMSYLAYRGMRVVGNAAIAVAIFSMLPFVVLVLWGLPSCTMPGSWLQLPDGGWDAIDWGTYLNVMFWNLNYWDSAASFAGEVENPGRVYPRALLTCVGVVILCNGLPVLVGTGSSAVAASAAVEAAQSGNSGERWSLWVDGYFADVATAIAGSWLGVWVVLAAAVANIGLFEAEMTSDAFQLMGMAERGMLPAAVAKRGPHGISTIAIVASSTGVIFLGLLEFEAIVEILNLLYCFAELLEFAAFIKLRMHHGDLYRPYAIPLGTVGVCVLLFPAAIFVVVLAAFSSMLTWAVAGLAVLIGWGMYPCLQVAKRRKWFEFHPLTLYEESFVGTDPVGSPRA